MNCSNIDLKGYFLGEAPLADRAAAESHVRECAACASELERMRTVRSALFAAPEEEMPRRIVFTEAKSAVAPAQPWWKWTFASAAMLSAAMVAHATWRPAAAPAPTVDVAAIEASVTAKLQPGLDQQVRQAVSTAVADAETRANDRAMKLVAATERRLNEEHRTEVVALQSNIELLTKRVNVWRTTAANYEVRQ